MKSIDKGTSRTVCVPSGVSSFFEICDKNEDGTPIVDALKVGARGGGFIIERGTRTIAQTDRTAKDDIVFINSNTTLAARTTLKVIHLMRKAFAFKPVKISHIVQPPIGSGFGTSGAGALGTAIALSDLFGLGLTLSEASDFAHAAEVERLTGLGTVISLASGSGSIGLVTEPGSYSVGRVDAILGDYSELVLICASFGPIEKSTVLQKERSRKLVNKFGRSTLESILDDPTPESLLRQSRVFAEKTRIAPPALLALSDKAVKIGAIGATQNMIGNAVHCLVERKKRNSFLASFKQLVPRESLFESDLCHRGPYIE